MSTENITALIEEVDNTLGAYRAAVAVETDMRNSYHAAIAGLRAALIEKHGWQPGALLKTKDGNEVKLASVGTIRDGKLLGYAFDRTKVGMWSKAPRIRLTLWERPANG